MTLLNDVSTAVGQINKLKSHRDSINSQVSNVDRDINDHYHVLELVDLDAVEIMKVTSSLRKLLKLRRKLKEDQILVNNFLSSSVDSAKSPATHSQNAEDREKKYIREAYQSFSRITGKNKKSPV